MILNTDKIACYNPVGPCKISDSCILFHFVIFLIVSRLFSASSMFLPTCKFVCPNYCTSYPQTVWNCFSNIEIMKHNTITECGVDKKPCTSVCLMLTVSIYTLISFCRISDKEICLMKVGFITTSIGIIPYPMAFPYGNGMVLHFYQQQESSTTKIVHKVINKGLKAYV